MPELLWTTKDLITVSLAVVAFALSLLNAWKAWRDRQQDHLRTCRSQLTDVLAKISDTRLTQQEKVDKPGDTAEVKRAKRDARGHLSDRLRFLAHQASFLAEQIPDRVAPIEWGLMALACMEFEDWELAEASLKRSLAGAQTARDSGSARRQLARVRFNTGRLVQGREDFEAALVNYDTEASDRSKNDSVETLLRWAELEHFHGQGQAAVVLLDRADEIALKIDARERRSSLQENVASRGNVIREAAAPPLLPASPS